MKTIAIFSVLVLSLSAHAQISYGGVGGVHIGGGMRVGGVGGTPMSGPNHDRSADDAEVKHCDDNMKTLGLKETDIVEVRFIGENNPVFGGDTFSEEEYRIDVDLCTAKGECLQYDFSRPVSRPKIKSSQIVVPLEATPLACRYLAPDVSHMRVKFETSDFLVDEVLGEGILDLKSLRQGARTKSVVDPVSRQVVGRFIVSIKPAASVKK